MNLGGGTIYDITSRSVSDCAEVENIALELNSGEEGHGQEEVCV